MAISQGGPVRQPRYVDALAGFPREPVARWWMLSSSGPDALARRGHCIGWEGPGDIFSSDEEFVGSGEWQCEMKLFSDITRLWRARTRGCG